MKSFLDINDESINHVLQLIDPKLKGFIDLNKKVDLINALHELDVNDNDDTMDVLSKKYRDLLANEKRYRDEFKRQPSFCDRLHGK